MTADTRIRDKPAPLSVQVTQAERAVLEQRRLVVARATSLHQSLGRSLTSPMMLLFAGGLGIFAERMTTRRAMAPSNVAPPRALRNKLLPGLLKVIAFVRLLRAVFPVEYGRRLHHGISDG